MTTGYMIALSLILELTNRDESCIAALVSILPFEVTYH